MNSAEPTSMFTNTSLIDLTFWLAFAPVMLNRNLSLHQLIATTTKSVLRNVDKKAAVTSRVFVFWFISSFVMTYLYSSSFLCPYFLFCFVWLSFPPCAFSLISHQVFSFWLPHPILVHYHLLQQISSRFSARPLYVDCFSSAVLFIPLFFLPLPRSSQPNNSTSRIIVFFIS